MPKNFDNDSVINLIKHLKGKMNPEDFDEALDVFSGNKEPAAVDPAKMDKSQAAMDRLPPHIRQQVANWNVKRQVEAAKSFAGRFPDSGRLS